MGPWREQKAPEGGVGVWPQPLETQAQVKVQLEKFHCPMGAKGELLGPGHHQGRRQATQGAEEKEKWVWQRHPPTWAAKLQQQGMGPWHEPEAPKGVEGGGTTEDVHAGKGHPEHSERWDGRE